MFGESCGTMFFEPSLRMSLLGTSFQDVANQDAADLGIVASGEALTSFSQN